MSMTTTTSTSSQKQISGKSQCHPGDLLQRTSDLPRSITSRHIAPRHTASYHTRSLHIISMFIHSNTLPNPNGFTYMFTHMNKDKKKFHEFVWLATRYHTYPQNKITATARTDLLFGPARARCGDRRQHPVRYVTHTGCDTSKIPHPLDQLSTLNRFLNNHGN